MTLQSRVQRLETGAPKLVLIGLTITHEGRVVGVAPFREPNPALELWARTGEPKRTTALLFASDTDRTPPTVPQGQMHPAALAAAERTAQGNTS